ncbi:MAG: GNAT family N-acetyltransferase [Acidimicrobiales bacterium]
MATLRDLAADPDEALLARFYDDMLVPYFSEGERVQLSALQGGLLAEPRDTDAVVAVDDDGAVVGGAVGEWDGDADVYLLSYLAVRADLRSQGLGAQLMDHVRGWWEARGAGVALAEVDDPRHHEVSDYGDPAARLRFYERVGARVLGVPYTQPEVRAGSGRVPGMLLISFVVSNEALDGYGLRADVLRRFLGNYLMFSEGATPETVEAAVDGLMPELAGRTAAIPILPMASYAEI